MKKMANLCIFLIVISCLQIVLANYCTDSGNQRSCDECIRCGGSWCPGKTEDGHCAISPSESWCDVGTETLPRIDDKDNHGTKAPGLSSLSPGYLETTILPGSQKRLTFSYNSDIELNVSFALYNTTQTSAFSFELIENKCAKSNCSFIMQTTASQNFCLRDGTVNEFAYVVVTLNSTEAAVKFHVPCACECSKFKERKSPRCNQNGDWSCGVCECYKGASGEDCNECPPGRGDNKCTDDRNPGLTCSGNGYCGPCETCICYPYGEGHQYFDPDNYCADICIITNFDFEICLGNGTLGSCTENGNSIIIEEYNETIIAEKGEWHRNVWVHCNETTNDCYIEYLAKKDEEGITHVMIAKSCNDIAGAAAVATTTKVPVIIAALGVVACIATVAGVLLWKHLHSVPPLPLTDSNYQNIDAEDCIGENPLYKPPMSSYKNPTYGKL